MAMRIGSIVAQWHLHISCVTSVLILCRFGQVQFGALSVSGFLAHLQLCASEPQQNVTQHALQSENVNRREYLPLAGPVFSFSTSGHGEMLFFLFDFDVCFCCRFNCSRGHSLPTLRVEVRVIFVVQSLCTCYFFQGLRSVVGDRGCSSRRGLSMALCPFIVPRCVCFGGLSEIGARIFRFMLI